MKLGGQRQAPGHFAPRKDTRSSCTGGWVGRRPGLEDAQNLAPPGFWIAVWRTWRLSARTAALSCRSAFLLLASHDISLSYSSWQIIVSRLQPFIALTAIQQLISQFPTEFPSLPALEVTALTTDCFGSGSELREGTSALVKLGEYG